ncbi:MAG: DNA topoisomerase [Planctomycetota bacterium]
MAKKKTSKKTTKKKTTRKKAASRAAVDASGKRLVIVESPAKAKTINRYLGPEYIVEASVGHVRDLPSKSPKGDKSPVPGVDLEQDFEPTYTVLDGKNKTVTTLKRAAKQASEVWFATDLDREGEAIAWHLAELLGVEPTNAKRVVFNAITRTEIERAFSTPHTINMSKVDAQQARRILDRIVGYQVSPLLWKKVARGLSAGRVQSVAVRLVVEREREIRAFVPDESWKMTGRFALDVASARELAQAWPAFLATTDEKGKGPTVKKQNAWLAEHSGVKAELVEVGGKPFDISMPAPNLELDDDPLHPAPKKSPEFDDPDKKDLTPEVVRVAELAGLTDVDVAVTENEKGKGPDRWLRSVTGVIDPTTVYRVKSIETKRTSSRPAGPFITSTMQQAASTRFGFGAQRTMRTAQRLYEGIEVKGEGQVGLITYMRTDSTHLSGQAIEMARNYIDHEFGDDYLPEKPNFFGSSNKAAQEAHEAIRPTDVRRTPQSLKSALTVDQFKLYTAIWERYVACQMTPAKWDSTSVLLEGGTDPKTPVTFKASGRTLVFDGHYRVSGVPTASDEQTLPDLDEGRELHPFSIDPEQKFGSPPPRYTEASLIKVMESEGIGRPSTYASIVEVIQQRKYVELIDRRFHASDLGEVVTDKLLEAFPDIFEVGYTRDMESKLDEIESESKPWRDVLRDFYDPFVLKLDHAHENLSHAKAETRPAPHVCVQCGSPTVYRFGKNGVFLSCSTYPKCNYAAPVDREGNPMGAEYVNVRCPQSGKPMIKKTGRFGPFITTEVEEGESLSDALILNLDKKGKVKAPSPPPLETDLPCPKCSSPMNLRDGVRGPWLGCSAFPKCRGRGKWAELEDEKKKSLETQLKNLLKANPVPIIRTLDGKALTDERGQPLADAPTVDDLLIRDPDEIDEADVA